MRIALVSVLCAIPALFTASAQIDTSQPLVPQQQLIPSNGFPTDDVANYQTWLNYFRVRSWVETPANTGSINIAPSTGAYDVPGTVEMIPSPTDYTGFLREVIQGSDLPSLMWQDVGAEQTEEITSAIADLVFMATEKANPNLFQYPPSTVTCAMEIANFRNRRSAVFGGAGSPQLGSDFYGNAAWNTAGCSLYEIFAQKTGMNFVTLTRAWNANPPTSRDALLALFDSLVPEIEGVPPSTWFNANDPVAFCCMTDGTYLGTVVSGVSWFGSEFQNFGSGINPEALLAYLVDWQWSPATSESQGFYAPNATVAPSVCWSMLDATGKEVIPLQFGNSSMIEDVYFDITGQFGGSWYKQYPAGSYLVPVANSPDGVSCSTDPRLMVNNVIAVVDNDTMNSLQPGDLVVSVNGPQWGTLPMKNSYQIELVAPLSATMQTWPDMVIVQNIPKRSDGSFEEVTLKVTYSDGTVRIRTFQPAWEQPIWRTVADKDEPTLLAAQIQRSTDGAFPAGIAPRGIYSIYLKDATGNAPCVASSFPIPIDGSCGNALNDQGRTRVVFTAANGDLPGTEFFGRPIYVDTKQINFVAPAGIPVGTAVAIQVSVNGTPSFQSATGTIAAADPGVFVIDAAGHAAAIAATGANAGRILAIAGATASAGDILQVFGTGLGQKAVPVPDGTACSGADLAVATVTATIGGAPAKTPYAGCAPGFAGLDQINVVVPSGLASGDQPIIVTAGGVASTPTMVPIQ